MNLKKALPLIALIGGMSLCGESSLVHAIEYEQEWIKSWGGGDDDISKSITQISDGGFVIAGCTYSSDAGFVNKGGQEAILIKQDSDGNQEWINSWGGSKNDTFNSVAPTADGGFVVVGESNSTDAGFANQGSYDAFIIKQDSGGNQEWMKSWGGNKNDRFNSVAQTTDGGFVAVGESNSTDLGFANQGSYDAFIVKYDQNGNQEWLNSWGGSDSDAFTSVTQTSDGGFAIVGHSYSADVGFANQGIYDAFIVKYDQNGNQEWLSSWGGSQTDAFDSVVQTSDGGFVAVGNSSSTDAGVATKGFSYAVIVKYDQNGNQEWANSWGEDISNLFKSVVPTSDGGFVAVGYSSSTAVIVKYDKNGNQEWSNSWRGNGLVFLVSATLTLDEGVAIAAYSRATDAGFTNYGGSDIVIIKYTPKTDADIQINGTIKAAIADITIPSVSPDLVINPNLPDGAMSPEFEIQNDSNSPIRLELKVFEQTTNVFNDVLPDKYSSWEGLNKTQSQDLALGLVAKDGVDWQQLTTPTSYVANHTEHEIGVMKPTSSVSFEFDIHHGRAFSEAKTVQYRMVFVFDLLN